MRLTNIIRQHIPNCHLSGQSEQRKTSRVTNEDLQQLHAQAREDADDQATIGFISARDWF